MPDDLHKLSYATQKPTQRQPDLGWGIRIATGLLAIIGLVESIYFTYMTITQAWPTRQGLLLSLLCAGVFVLAGMVALRGRYA